MSPFSVSARHGDHPVYGGKLVVPAGRFRLSFRPTADTSAGSRPIRKRFGVQGRVGESRVEWGVGRSEMPPESEQLLRKRAS